MKVAQISLDGYFNCGNVLQKYALQKTLKKFADEVEFLWHGDNNFWPETGEIPTIPDWVVQATQNPVPRYLALESVRCFKIKEFYDRYIKTRFNLPYLETTADEYDFFVVGSDQIWNPFCEPINMMYSVIFLPFVPNKKKISYAASIAIAKLPDEIKNYFRDGISSFAHVSVREENAVKIVEDLGLEPPPVLLDPVLLLTPDEWLKIAKRPSWLNKKYERGYILTYYLRNAPPPEIKAVAAELNLPVINLMDSNNFNHYTAAPEEIVYLFANATLIYINSFHGVAFSILFKRPFINCEYEDTTINSMLMRIPSLLKMFGLEGRRVLAEDFHKIKSPLEMDFSVSEKILPQERMKAFNFLSNALGVEMPAELREVDAQ